MRTGPDLKKTLLAILAFLPVALFASNVFSEQGVPATLAGAWVVTAVRLDTTSTRRTYYNYNDHRLIGGKIRIAANMAKGEMPEKATCFGPIVRSESTTMNRLIATSMANQEDDNKANLAIKYELPVEGEKKLRVFWIGCKEGDLGPDAPLGPEGYNWVAQLSATRIAMRWYDNTILLLKRQR